MEISGTVMNSKKAQPRRQGWSQTANGSAEGGSPPPPWGPFAAATNSASGSILLARGAARCMPAPGAHPERSQITRRRRSHLRESPRSACIRVPRDLRRLWDRALWDSTLQAKKNYPYGNNENQVPKVARAPERAGLRIIPTRAFVYGQPANRTHSAHKSRTNRAHIAHKSHSRYISKIASPPAFW